MASALTSENIGPRSMVRNRSAHRASADRTTERVELLYNLSVVAQRAGNLQEAIDFAVWHICDSGAKLTGQDLYIARGRLEQLRDELKALAPPGAKSSPSTPAPGPSSPAASLGDQPRQPDRLHRLPVGGWALVGTGGALLLIGVGCGAGALATAGHFDGTPLTVNQINGLTSQGQALNAAAITLDDVAIAPAPG